MAEQQSDVENFRLSALRSSERRVVPVSAPSRSLSRFEDAWPGGLRAGRLRLMGRAVLRVEEVHRVPGLFELRQGRCRRHPFNRSVQARVGQCIGHRAHERHRDAPRPLRSAGRAAARLGRLRRCAALHLVHVEGGRR